MIGFKKIFGVPRHRVFHYKPLYFDDIEESAKKELRKKMMFEGLSEKDAEAELRKLKFRAKFAKAKERARGNTGIGFEETMERRLREERNVKTRVISIILILTFIAWWFLG